MNQNPFSSNTASSNPPWAGEPGPISETVPLGVVGAIHEAKNLAEDIKIAKDSGNYIFLDWMAKKAQTLVGYLLEFMKKAFQLAIFKFALELCAMIIRSLMDALVSGGYGAMDMSTKGIMWHGDGAAPNARTNNFGNPFDSPFNTARPW